ncbi:MAG: hypothetical protein WCL29_05110 [Pseudomonadota bacterium]
MSKELETLEMTHAIVEIAFDEVTPLDDLSLALIGGGECVVVA